MHFLKTEDKDLNLGNNHLEIATVLPPGVPLGISSTFPSLVFYKNVLITYLQEIQIISNDI